MKSLITLGRRGALLAVVALAVACGTSSGGTTSSGTGGAGTGGVNASGTTTGGSVCGHNGDSCAAAACCTGLGLTCNDAKICVGPQSTGTGTGTGGTGVDTCPIGDAGATCVTSVECESGLFCVDGICTVPTPETPLCTPNGTGPITGSPCCESTEDAGPAGLNCVGWIPCLTAGEGCTAGGNCCNGLSCGTDGTCDAVCAGYLQTCTVDADCCAEEGTSCVKGSMFTNNPPIPGSFCYPIGLPIQQIVTGGSYYCDSQPQCTAFNMGNKGIVDCQLGATCNVGISEDGGVDPCAVDGLVCDTNFSIPVCRNPELFEACTPGGPSCFDRSNASTSPLVCSQPIFGQIGGTSLCTDECQATEDCVLPWQTCIYALDSVYETCDYANQVTNCETASDWLQPCDAASVGDGVCLVAGGDQVGLCTQAYTDGDGGPGAACDVNANRQLGGFCDTSDICMGNICGQLCNAGTSKTPACGAGLACVPVMDIYGINLGPEPSTDTVTSGACVTPCDFTILDAGECAAATDQEPTKCMPAEYFQFAPSAYPDFCVAAAPAAQAIPIGADCGKAVIGNAIDVCVAGAECYAPVINATETCMQLCKAPFGKGLGGCPATYTCTAADYTNTPSTQTGVCVPPAATDGG